MEKLLKADEIARILNLSRERGSDFDDSTFFAASMAERISLVRKQSKGNRYCKQELLMNTEFRFKGPRREMVFRYIGREWAYLVTIVVLGIAVLLVAVIVAKRMLGL